MDLYFAFRIPETVNNPRIYSVFRDRLRSHTGHYPPLRSLLPGKIAHRLRGPTASQESFGEFSEEDYSNFYDHCNHATKQGAAHRGGGRASLEQGEGDREGKGGGRFAPPLPPSALLPPPSSSYSLTAAAVASCAEDASMLRIGEGAGRGREPHGSPDQVGRPQNVFFQVFSIVKSCYKNARPTGKCFFLIPSILRVEIPSSARPGRTLDLPASAPAGEGSAERGLGSGPAPAPLPPARGARGKRIVRARHGGGAPRGLFGGAIATFGQ